MFDWRVLGLSFSAVVLVGCGSPVGLSEDDVAGIAHDVAMDATSAQRERIEELEAKTAELEEQQRRDSETIDELLLGMISVCKQIEC